MENERRRTPRIVFSATAEIFGPSAGVRTGRVKDLSRSGAYVAMPDPFSKDAKVQIVIHTETETFRCEGRVAHATEGIGMGVEFSEIEPDFEKVLQEWLSDGG